MKKTKIIGKLAKDCLIIIEKKDGVRKFITNENIVDLIGTKNANKVIRATIELKEDQTIIKFRKCGKIEIYLK